MRRPRLVRFAIGASALALVAAGCGGGSSGGGNNPAPKPKAAANVFNAGLSGVRNQSTKAGGTLNFISDGDCDYWDPARTYYGFCWDMQRLISRGLMGYVAGPGNASLNVVPDLASAAGTSNDGGKTWTYKIKPGLKMSDGEVITTKMIKYDIERVFAQTVINGGPTYVITYLCPGGPNAAGGCDTYKGPYTDKDPNHLGLSTIETPDDNTITFKLDKAVGDWNYIMALPASSPVPIAFDQGPKGGAHYTNNPVSSGPYMFGSYTPNKSLTLVRNPNWSASSDPFRKALPDKIVFTVDVNDDDKDKRIINNIADVDIAGTGVQVATQAQILGNPTLKARADNPVTGATRYLAIESQVPPFNNIHCRMAVQYGVSKVDWQTARGGPIGGGQIATTMLNPAVKGYTSFDLYPDNNGNGDIAKAKSELAACGKPNGFTTHMRGQNTGKGKATAEAVQASLKRIGINVVIDLGAPATYYSQYIGSPSVNKKNDAGLMYAGWGADWPTGFGFFSSLVDGRKILAQGNSNYSETNDPKVNSLIDQAVSQTDANKAADLWGQVDKEVMSQATLVPMTYDKALDIISTNVSNAYILLALLGCYDYQAMGHV